MDIAAEYVFAPDVLGILLPVAPNLRIRFHPDHIPDIAGRLKDGRLNYALEYGPVLSDEFDSAHFADETLSVICAKSHPSIKGSLSWSNTRRFRMCRWSHAPAFLLVKQLEK
ncbi:MAG: hypothetical protein IPF57_22095 [Gammaproteobacteria bacterium]|nr:hypothetical protein [Gammaproteobacteria bacterium]